MRPTTAQIRRRRWIVAAALAVVVAAGAMFANYHLAAVPAKADAAAYTAGWVVGDGAALAGYPATVDRVCPSAWVEVRTVDHPYDHRAEIEAGCAAAFSEVRAGR